MRKCCLMPVALHLAAHRGRSLSFHYFLHYFKLQKRQNYQSCFVDAMFMNNHGQRCCFLWLLDNKSNNVKQQQQDAAFAMRSCSNRTRSYDVFFKLVKVLNGYVGGVKIWLSQRGTVLFKIWTAAHIFPQSLHKYSILHVAVHIKSVRSKCVNY